MATTWGSFFSVLPRTIPSVLLSVGLGTSTPQFVNNDNDNDAQTTIPTRPGFILNLQELSASRRTEARADSCPRRSDPASDKLRSRSRDRRCRIGIACRGRAERLGDSAAA
jgi:hypothetical protein